MRFFILGSFLVAGMGTWMTERAMAHHETPRTRIHEASREVEHVDRRTFCSKTSEKEAASKCQAWLSEQKKSLGERLLTASCDDGAQTADAACLFRADGDVKYVTKEKTVIYDE